MHNPFWDEVCKYAEPSQWPPWEEGQLVIGDPCLGYVDGELKMLDTETQISRFQMRWEMSGKYSWTIPDPGTLAFVAEQSDGRLVDVMAGTGYWTYLLSQLGVDVISYDLEPGQSHWHVGYSLHAEIQQMDCAESAAKHSDRTLLLSWPPYSDPAGVRAVQAYTGKRIIYIGEYDGCTGDDALREELEGNWTEVASHRPVRWYGLYDRVMVYERVNNMSTVRHDVAQSQ